MAMSVPSPSSVGYDPVRQHDASGGSDHGRRRATPHPGLHASAIALSLFQDRFGRPGKGKVEALVKTARRTFLFAGRHNVREFTTIDQMGWLAKRTAGKRLSYTDLIA